jgi:hypothetical protein
MVRAQMLEAQIKLVKLKVHVGCPRTVAQASDRTPATSIPARDTLSTVLWLYLCSDNHLPAEAGA